MPYGVMGTTGPGQTNWDRSGASEPTASAALASKSASQAGLYGQILAGFDQRIQDGMYYGQQQYKDTADQWATQGSKIAQSMIDKGLSGSTVEATMQQGNQVQADQARNRLQDYLTSKQLGLQKDKLDFMASQLPRSGSVGPLGQAYNEGPANSGSGEGGNPVSSGGFLNAPPRENPYMDPVPFVPYGYGGYGQPGYGGTPQVPQQTAAQFNAARQAQVYNSGQRDPYALGRYGMSPNLAY